LNQVPLENLKDENEQYQKYLLLRNTRETDIDEAVKSGHGEGSFVVIRGRKEP
jgi:hypothetical protein